jgi:DNA transformation protein
MPRPARRRTKPQQQKRMAPLKVGESFTAYVLDQLSEFGEIEPKKMFGGVGLYRDGVFFGLLARDTLFLKVDEQNRGDYQRAGMKAFKPFANRPGSKNYFAVPLPILESPIDLAAWARKAFAAAERASG